MSLWFELIMVGVLGGAALISAMNGEPLPSRPKRRVEDPPQPPALEPDPLGGELLDELAERLGLVHRGRGVEGTRKGVAIEIVAEPYGSEDPAELRCAARFAVPLGVGLDVRAGTTASGADAFVTPGFDAALHVEADDMDAARSVLRGRAGDLLLACELEGKQPWLDATGAGVVLAASADAATVGAAIDRLVHIVEAVNRARPANVHRQDARLGALDVLRALAERTGGALDETAFELAFESPRGKFLVRLDEDGVTAWATSIDVAFAHELPAAPLELEHRVDAFVLEPTRLHAEVHRVYEARRIAGLVDDVERAIETLAARAATHPYR